MGLAAHVRRTRRWIVAAEYPMRCSFGGKSDHDSRQSYVSDLKYTAFSRTARTSASMMAFRPIVASSSTSSTSSFDSATAPIVLPMRRKDACFRLPPGPLRSSIDLQVVVGCLQVWPSSL